MPDLRVSNPVYKIFFQKSRINPIFQQHSGNFVIVHISLNFTGYFHIKMSKAHSCKPFPIIAANVQTKKTVHIRKISREKK